MKWIDLPPFWLLACVVIAWGLAGATPACGFGPWSVWAGALLIAAGIIADDNGDLEFNAGQDHGRPAPDPQRAS